MAGEKRSIKREYVVLQVQADKLMKEARVYVCSERAVAQLNAAKVGRNLNMQFLKIGSLLLLIKLRLSNFNSGTADAAPC